MKLLSVAVVTLAAATAFAAKSNTEYYYQPAGGQQAVEIHYDMDSNPQQDDAGNDAAKTATSDFQLAYWYGLSEGNAIGIHTAFGSLKTTTGNTDHTASGLGDIFLGYHGFSDMWHYGVDLGINMGKAKLDDTTGMADNRSSGGMSVIPYVGAMWSAGSSNYGVNLKYDYLMERSIDDAAGTKVDDGSIFSLAPFYEWNYGMGFLGAELSYNMMADYKVKAATDTTYKGQNVTAVKLFGSYDFSDMVTGLLDLGFGMHPSHDVTSAGGSSYKAYTETDINIGVRLNF